MIGVCVRRRGKVVLDRAIGHLRGNSPDDPPEAAKVPIRASSLFSLYSASKAITAMVVHLLDERGVVHLDDPIAEYIPEFARREVVLTKFNEADASFEARPATR